MGVNFYAYAAIGLRVDYDQLTTRRTVRAFPHDYPETVQFCPQTGRKLWTEAAIPHPALGLDADAELHELAEFLDCPVLHFSTPGSQSCIFAIAHAQASERGGDELAACDLEDLAAARRSLQAVLEPLGVWDDDEFGLWAILDISV